MSDPAPLVVVPVNENIPRTDKSAASAPAPAEPLPVRPRRGQWVSVLCAVLALLAAVVVLAAPGLRPRIAAVADHWFGPSNVVALLLTPSPALEAGWQQAREEAMHALDMRFADYAGRLDHLAAAQQATASDVARVVATQHSRQATDEALTRAVDDLTRQTGELRAAATAIDARARAAALLGLSLRLRRDVDAGLPIDRDVTALAVAGPFPAPIGRAVQQLRGLSDGTPTMRDLADGLDQVLAQLAARSGGDGSWLRTGWDRVSALFGNTPPQQVTLIERLRALAADGRFAEAATELEASDTAGIGANWAANVHARANAVLATQALMTYSLAVYHTAFAATAGSE